MHKGMNIVMKVLVLTGILLATACSSLASDRPGYTVIKEFQDFIVRSRTVSIPIMIREINRLFTKLI
jgi:hypothetical protein